MEGRQQRRKTDISGTLRCVGLGEKWAEADVVIFQGCSRAVQGAKETRAQTSGPALGKQATCTAANASLSTQRKGAVETLEGCSGIFPGCLLSVQSKVLLLLQ